MKHHRCARYSAREWVSRGALNHSCGRSTKPRRAPLIPCEVAAGVCATPGVGRTGHPGAHRLPAGAKSTVGVPRVFKCGEGKGGDNGNEGVEGCCLDQPRRGHVRGVRIPSHASHCVGGENRRVSFRAPSSPSREGVVPIAMPRIGLGWKLRAEGRGQWTNSSLLKHPRAPTGGDRRPLGVGCCEPLAGFAPIRCRQERTDTTGKRDAHPIRP